MPRPRDPHAHVIHVPGARLARGVPLRFVREHAGGGGRRTVSASLNVVSFLDLLVVTVLFLLTSFSASGETPDRRIKLAGAVNVMDQIDSPLVTVSNGLILVDGVAAGTSRPIAESGRMWKIEELGKILEQKRLLWQAVEPTRPFPGECLLQIDRDVPAVVVKSVFQTAVLAGYPHVSFMVKKLGAP